MYRCRTRDGYHVLKNFIGIPEAIYSFGLWPPQVSHEKARGQKLNGLNPTKRKYKNISKLTTKAKGWIADAGLYLNWSFNFKNHKLRIKLTGSAWCRMHVKCYRLSFRCTWSHRHNDVCCKYVVENSGTTIADSKLPNSLGKQKQATFSYVLIPFLCSSKAWNLFVCGKWLKCYVNIERSITYKSRERFCLVLLTVAIRPGKHCCLAESLAPAWPS